MVTIHISHKISQKLRLTPKLIQALYILRLPNPALREYLIKHVEENPLLQPLSEKELDDKIKGLLISQTGDRGYPAYSRAGIPEEKIQLLESPNSDTTTLHDYLLHQLKMTFLNDEELAIAEEIISNINDNGYLYTPLEAIANDMDIPLEKIEKILGIIQTFEPSGIGARNLQECLLIQLKNSGRKDSLAYSIVESYFKELTRKRYRDIAQKMNVEVREIEKVAKEIASLNSKPGASFAKDNNISITPDITVRKDKNKIKIMLNEKDLPELRINTQYIKLLNNTNVSEETKKFINERLKSALWLIRSMGERRKNILKVMRAVFKVQRQALFKGFSFIKPLTMKDTAEITGLHYSTVSRIIANKYAATPQGTIKLKDMFSRRYKSAHGIAISGKTISHRIHYVIQNENKEKPLTDQMIFDILKKDGILVSRRTIAKYRDRLKIPPSFLRITLY